MLIGMAAQKLRLFDAKRSQRVYLSLIAAAVLIGLPLVYYGVHRNFEVGWDAGYSAFIGWQYNYWGSIPLSLGWIGLVMLLYRRIPVRWTRSLAAVGRTALSNYLLQTILCTTIFYGHGFAMYGKVDRVGQIAIMIVIWCIQIVASMLWMRRYRLGPAEYAWRTLTYMKLPTFRAS